MKTVEKLKNHLERKGNVWQIRTPGHFQTIGIFNTREDAEAQISAMYNNNNIAEEIFWDVRREIEVERYLEK